MNLNKQEPSPQTSYRTIPLTQGQVAIVDAADFEWLSKWKWHAHWSEFTQSFYAGRVEYLGDYEQYYVAMHREILGLKYRDKRQGDHKNGNTLDNQRHNLRIATRSQNKQNSKKYRNNKSGFKGVSFHRRIGKWMAAIQVNGKPHYLGYHPTPEAAHAAYCAAAKELHGDFANLG